MEKKVGVILINYKDYAKRFLEPCRDSLRRQSYGQDNFLVYIIDNASSDESLDYLNNTYPEAKIIPRFDGNYSAAGNLGFKAALEDGCDYVVSANMDTEMESDWLKELVLALEKNQQAGIVQSKILLYPQNDAEKNNPKINSLGNVIHFLGFGFTSSYNQEDKERKGQELYPEIKGYASGCSFIIKKEVLLALDCDNDNQYYNEEYYMYHDDLELSLKTKLAGYKIILAPLSRIFHKYEFSRSTKMIYFMERNRYLTLFIFYPRSFLFLIFLPLFAFDVAFLFYSFLGGWFKEEMKIYKYFLKTDNYNKIFTARDKVKKISRVPFKDLARDFSGKIEFQEIANPLLDYFVNPLTNWYWRLIKKII